MVENILKCQTTQNMYFNKNCERINSVDFE